MALGGYSLAASRVITRVIQSFQLDLPITAFFGAPTIAQMAQLIVEYHESKPNNEERDHILTKIEAMSEEEAERLLADQRLAHRWT